MTDFMRWLYANYIKPQLDEADSTPYEMSLSLLDSCLDEDLKTQYGRALEFYAGHAFLLGDRKSTRLNSSH